MRKLNITLESRTGVGDIVRECAAGTISFDEACERVAAMGFKTTMLHEMIIQEEARLESARKATP